MFYRRVFACKWLYMPMFIVMQAIKARFNDTFKLVFTFSNRDFHPCGEKIKNNCN